MTDEDILDEFGASLMKSVRDVSIDRNISILYGKSKAPDHIKLHKLLLQFDEKQLSLISDLVTRAIDNTLFNLLFMFEEESDKKKIISNGVDINKISDGLAGELFSEEGWIYKFSNR